MWNTGCRIAQIGRHVEIYHEHYGIECNESQLTQSSGIETLYVSFHKRKIDKNVLHILA